MLERLSLIAVSAETLDRLRKAATGSEFRHLAKIILRQVAASVVAGLGEHAVVAMNWPTGVVFAEPFAEQGCTEFYHLHFHRDPVELTTVIDMAYGAPLPLDRPIVVVEPMLATGNTISVVIDHLKQQGISENNVTVICLIAAQPGIERLTAMYPEVKFMAVAVDQSVNEEGHIVPGLGDVLEKYFADISVEELARQDAVLDLPRDLQAMLHSYIRRHPLHNELRLLVVRDRQDAVVADRVRHDLITDGLVPQKPERVLTIDTGIVVGVEAVVEVIVQELKTLPAHCLIAIEGVSGVGKSSTTKHLQERIEAISFSLGEVFRYLAYVQLHGEESMAQVLARLSYLPSRKGLELHDGGLNISQTLASELRTPEIERLVPQATAHAQSGVVRFVAESLTKMRGNLKRPVILEGRNYTLDFLPSDLRIILTADPVVRAERRLGSS